MSCPDLGSSSTRTPKNTNTNFKHKNICPDFLASFLHFLALSCQPNTNTNQSPARTQTQTQQQVFSDFLKPQNPDTQNLNSNLDFLIFQSTTKPPANKIHKSRNQIHKPRKFSIKTPLKKKIINSKATILKPKENHFSVLFHSLFGCQENERIKIWTAPSKSIQSPYYFVSIVSPDKNTNT